MVETCPATVIISSQFHYDHLRRIISLSFSHYSFSDQLRRMTFSMFHRGGRSNCPLVRGVGLLSGGNLAMELPPPKGPSLQFLGDGLRWRSLGGCFNVLCCFEVCPSCFYIVFFVLYCFLMIATCF